MTPGQLRIKAWREDPALFVRDNFKVEPDVWQREVLETFASPDPSKMRISMQACAGPGKLLSCVTPVYTPNGIKKHGDLEVGDEVIALDGTPTKVVATIVWDNIQMYRVTFSDGSYVDAGAQHMWLIQSRHHKKFHDWGVAETQEILKLEPTKIYPSMSRSGTDRKVRRFRIPIQGAAHFTPNDEDIELPIHPYLLGLWLGDGSRNASSITKDDPEPFAHVATLGYQVTSHKKHDGAGQKYNVSGLLAQLKVLGLSESYSGQRYIPETYKRSSSRQRRELLMGLMDTDGRIKTNGMMDFHSTSIRLLKDFVWLARSIGCYAHSDRETDTHKETSDCYSASVRTAFNPFRIKRKSERWKMPPDHAMYRYIDSIKPLGIESGKCIEVEHKDHCYQVGDFIVTHNSAVLAWCGWNFLSCYGEPGHHPKAAVMSITSDNLKDGLWAELSKWQSESEFLSKAFKWTKERIFAIDHPETWFMSARSFPKTANAEEQGRTLSGLHSKYILYLLDESGDISPNVLKSAEQGLSTGPIFGKILQAGNPTSLDGMLYAAATILREQWYVVVITGDPDDPRRSKRIDPVWASEQIKAYGRDNPWVKSFILGQFPPSSINALFSIEDVQAAMQREYREEEYAWAQKRIGVDVARFGDDLTCLFPRQGLQAFTPVIMRNANTTEITNRVLMAKAKWGSELEFIDGTGGYGAGVVDQLRLAGQSPMEIHFSSKASSDKYLNKRAEMWFEMNEWVKRGGALPNDARLVKELVSPTYTFSKGKFQLEPKDQIKKRLGFSPDVADSLALTFSHPDQPAADSIQGLMRRHREETDNGDWDPFHDSKT